MHCSIKYPENKEPLFKLQEHRKKKFVLLMPPLMTQSEPNNKFT